MQAPSVIHSQPSFGPKSENTDKGLAQTKDHEMVDFAQILAGEGAVEGISKDDLSRFFSHKKSNSHKMSIEELYKFMTKTENLEFLKEYEFDGESFISQKGEKLSPSEMVDYLKSHNDETENKLSSQEELNNKETRNKKISNLFINENNEITHKHDPKNSSLKSGEDFLNQKIMMRSSETQREEGISKKNKMPFMSRNPYEEQIKSSKKSIIEIGTLRDNGNFKNNLGKQQLEVENKNFGLNKNFGNITPSRNLISQYKTGENKSIIQPIEKSKPFLTDINSRNKDIELSSLGKTNQKSDSQPLDRDSVEEIFNDNETLKNHREDFKLQNPIRSLTNSAKEDHVNELSLKNNDTQVIDLSNIKAENKIQLMNKIGSYIEQSYVSGRDTVELIVSHDELGQFKIMANKVGRGNQVNLEINTLTDKGQQFFTDNEPLLIRNLTDSGIKLSEVKIISNSDIILTSEGRPSGNDSFSQSQGRGEQGSYQNSFRQFDDQTGQERRRQLWKNAQEYQKSLSA